MSNINTVALSGNLTRDVELRHTPSGTAVANLGLAVNRSRKVDDAWVDEPSFFEITAFSGRAEQCAKKLSKGSFVFVKGRLEQQRWENDAGEKRSKVVVIVETIEGPDFFKKGDDAAQTSTPAAGAQDDDIPF